MNARQALYGVAAATLLFSAAAPAGDTNGPVVDASQTVLVPVLDVLVARPMGLVVTSAGICALAILFIPEALIVGGFPTDLANELAGKPFHFTFERPIGDFD